MASYFTALEELYFFETTGQNQKGAIYVFFQEDVWIVSEPP